MFHDPIFDIGIKFELGVKDCGSRSDVTTDSLGLDVLGTDSVKDGSV